VVGNPIEIPWYYWFILRAIILQNRESVDPILDSPRNFKAKFWKLIAQQSIKSEILLRETEREKEREREDKKLNW